MSIDRLLLAVLLALVAAAAVAADTLYIGTFTTRGSRTAQGIYVADFDPVRGTLGAVRLAASAVDPSFLALDTGRGLVFAVERPDTAAGQPGGAVAAYRMQADGGLALINRVEAGGLNPSHLSLTPDGSHVVSANFRGANVGVFPVAPDGELKPATQIIGYTHHSINPHRQAQPHPHAVNFSPALGAELVVVNEMGGDRLYLYRFDAKAGRLVAHAQPWAEAPAGAGPRHLAFHPGLPVAYAINELFNTVGIYDIDPAGPALRHRSQVFALPADFFGASTGAEVAVHPSGRFVYASNRGHDSIAVFAVNPADGGLTPRGHVSTRGRTPRNFVCDPSGRWLLAANQDSDTVAVFAIDPATGALTPHGEPVPVPTPVCLRFKPRP